MRTILPGTGRIVTSATGRKPSPKSEAPAEIRGRLVSAMPERRQPFATAAIA